MGLRPITTSVVNSILDQPQSYISTYRIDLYYACLEGKV